MSEWRAEVELACAVSALSHCRILQLAIVGIAENVACTC